MEEILAWVAYAVCSVFCIGLLLLNITGMVICCRLMRVSMS